MERGRKPISKGIVGEEAEEEEENLLKHHVLICHLQQRGMTATHLQMLLAGKCQLHGSLSGVVHIHRQLIWQDLCRFDKHAPSLFCL